MRNLAVIVIVFVISACAAPAYMPGVEVETKILSSPDIGEIAVANLGQTLLAKYAVSYRPALEILEAESWREVMIPWNLPAQKLKAIGQGTDGKPARWQGILKNTNVPQANYVVTVERNPDNQVLTARNSLTVYTHTLKAPTRETLIEEPSDTNFKQELVYNGRVGDDLRFVYREFSEGMARSAFSQEAQYDLKESSLIGFKSARIEVLEATNSTIRYKVISNF